MGTKGVKAGRVIAVAVTACLLAGGGPPGSTADTVPLPAAGEAIPAAVVVPPSPPAAEVVPAPSPLPPLPGEILNHPVTGRPMVVVEDVEKSALVIGDSQAGPSTWVGQGLALAGYPALIRGAGGTGYVQGNGTVSGYAQALESQQWLLPWGTPSLIILQGGGNDTAYPPEAVRAGARQLIRDIRQSYPGVRILMVGVIGDGTGPRQGVDDVLAATARGEGIGFLSPGRWWSQYGLTGVLRPDGRHLSPEGHRIAAEVFAREIGALAPPDTAASTVPDPRIRSLP